MTEPTPERPLLDHLSAEVERHFKDYLPPYMMVAGTENMLIPGFKETTVRMALEDVWDVARRDVLRILSEAAEPPRKES